METFGPHVETPHALSAYDREWIKNVLMERAIDDDTAHLQRLRNELSADEFIAQMRYLDIDTSGLSQFAKELDTKIHERVTEGMGELNAAISLSSEQVNVIITREQEGKGVMETKAVLMGFTIHDAAVVPVTESGIITDAADVRLIDIETD